MDRKCGMLLPVTSLPSKYGIGGFTKEAYEFVDFLAKAGQSYWQILPLGPTGYGDSPYQSFSTYAGNPYFIDVEALIEAGYISREDAEKSDFGRNPKQVDYEKIYHGRFSLLRKAYENSPYALNPNSDWNDIKFDKEREDFQAYCYEEEAWLSDYALYSAIKTARDGVSYIEWPDELIA